MPCQFPKNGQIPYSGAQAFASASAVAVTDRSPTMQRMTAKKSRASCQSTRWCQELAVPSPHKMVHDRKSQIYENRPPEGTSGRKIRPPRVRQ